MKPALRFAIPLALFMTLIGLFAVGLKLDPRTVPSPLIDKPAPDFALTTLAAPARTIRRADLLGKVWLLNVWASWCEACRGEHAYLIEFARTNAVPIYGLNYKDQRASAMAWLSQLGDPYEASLFDQDGRIGIDFGVYGVPETFLIDQQGIIRYKQIGPLTPDILQSQVLPRVRALHG